MSLRSNLNKTLVTRINRNHVTKKKFTLQGRRDDKMATSGHRAQTAIRAHGSNKCSKHYGKEVIYVCEDCDDLACTDCVIQQHKGHELEGLSNVIPKSKQKLYDFIPRAEQVEIPGIKRKLQKVSEDLSTNKKICKNQVFQIQQRNEIVKKKLDNITETLVKTCLDMEYKNSASFLTHEQELQTQIDELNLKIQEVKTTLQSRNDVLVYDTSCVIPSQFDDLSTPSCSTVEFITGPSALPQLEHLLGQLNITHLYQPNLSWSQNANWSVSPKFTQIPYAGHYVKTMHAAGDRLWLSFYQSSSGIVINTVLSIYEALSFNLKGQVEQLLNMNVRDFCMSPRTLNIWYCSGEDKKVREVTHSRETVKFTTDKSPWSICVTQDDHVLVGCETEIVKYTQTGQEVYRTSGGTEPIVKEPYHMSECPVTQHIAVVDRNNSYKGGKPYVSILDNQLQLLHTYRGEVAGQEPPPASFNPHDVCYTDTGELIITYWNNRSVVLVTGRGRYLQTLYTFIESKPRAVCVMKGCAWVSLDNGKVQLLTHDNQ